MYNFLSRPTLAIICHEGNQIGKKNNKIYFPNWSDPERDLQLHRSINKDKTVYRKIQQGT